MDKYFSTTEVAQSAGLALPTIHLWVKAKRFGNQIDLSTVSDRMETLYALRPDLAARQPRWLIPSRDVEAMKLALNAMYTRNEGHKKHLQNRPKRIETLEGGVFILPPPPGRR